MKPPTGLLSLFRRFSPEIRGEKRLLSLSMLGLIGEVSMRLLEPWPLKFVIDRVLDPAQKEAAVHPLLENAGPSALIVIAAVGLVVFGGLRALASYTSSVALSLVGNRILTRIRSDVYGHMQSLPLAFHNKARSGELIVRVINDVAMLKDVTVSAMLPLISNALVVAGMIGVMVWLDWRLAFLALVTLPLFWLRTMTLTKRLRHVAREQRRREGAMASTASETIGAIRVIKALSLEPNFSKAFSAQNNRSFRDGAKAKRLEAGIERTVDALIAVSSALVLWYGARLALSGALTAGVLVVFLTYLKSAFKPIRDFAKYTSRLTKASAAAERVLDLLDETPEVGSGPGTSPAPPFRGEIILDRLSFGYEDGCDVLRGIELRIGAGERVAIVGESGAGKSTIASLILRLYSPSGGRILIDGRDVSGYTLASLRSQIAVVLQDTLLFAGTIRDNIALGAADVPFSEVVAAAQLAKADEFISASPSGYDTIVGERGVTLSSGQRQRIAIARAAVRKSPILLLDEPTTGLDEENRRAVAIALDGLSRGRTTLVITHDLSLARMADRVVFLENGVIVESGTHTTLLAANGRYASMYRSQQRNDDPRLVSIDSRSALTA